MFEHQSYLLEKEQTSKQRKKLSLAATIGAIATIIAETILLDIPIGQVIAKALSALL